MCCRINGQCIDTIYLNQAVSFVIYLIRINLLRRYSKTRNITKMTRLIVPVYSILDDRSSVLVLGPVNPTRQNKVADL